MSHPTAFISYSWDSSAHKAWVVQIATRLRGDGVDICLDHWHAVPGDQLTKFMEQEIRDNDFVLIFCTPKYKHKSDNRIGGTGYEGDIMTAEVLTRQNHSKFIPILAWNDWKEAAPSWLAGKFYINLFVPDVFEAEYTKLLATLTGQIPKAPELGPVRKLVEPAKPNYQPEAAVNEQERILLIDCHLDGEIYLTPLGLYRRVYPDEEKAVSRHKRSCRPGDVPGRCLIPAA